MTRKRKSILAIITSLALAAIMCLTMAFPAFASTNKPVYAVDEDHPAQAAITKMFKMPENTITPDKTFTFKFEKLSYNNLNSEQDLEFMPVIGEEDKSGDFGTMSVSFTAANKGTSENGIKTVWLETDSIFADIDWEHAGVYSYRVSEIDDSYARFDETLDCSQASYILTAYVKEHSEGGYYVYAIAAEIEVNDASNEGETGKVNPTPGGDAQIDGDYSKMIFTNIFVKNNGGTTLDDTVAKISKTVTGDYANKDQYFEFEIVMTKPNIGVDTEPVYTAYICELDELGNVVIVTSEKHTPDGQDGDNNDILLFPSGDAPRSVFLKHGQWIAFIDLHVGTHGNVTELAAQNYTPSYNLTLDGTPILNVPGDENEPLGFSRYLSDGIVAVSFINEHQAINPTGITVDNLPYIALIGLALVALVGYLTVKTRKTRAAMSK